MENWVGQGKICFTILLNTTECRYVILVTGKNENQFKTLKCFQISLAISIASLWALVLPHFMIVGKLNGKIHSPLPLQKTLPLCVVQINLMDAGVHNIKTGVFRNVFLVSLVFNINSCTTRGSNSVVVHVVPDVYQLVLKLETC